MKSYNQMGGLDVEEYDMDSFNNRRSFNDK